MKLLKLQLPSILLGLFTGLIASLLVHRVVRGSYDNPFPNRLEPISGFHISHLRALIEEVSCRSVKIGTRGGFCLSPTDPIRGGNNMWCPKLSATLDNLFKHQTIGDFGCGLGHYGRYFLRRGDRLMPYSPTVEESIFLNRSEVVAVLKEPQKIASWTGFDGAGNIESIIKNRFIKFLDLSEEQHLPEKYHWVMSFEVGEHIPVVFEDIFLENIARHACRGVVLSWAALGQKGHHHVNCRDNKYIKAKMAKLGFYNDLKTEQMIRAATPVKYFKKTLMVFQRTSPLTDESCVRRANI
ncbi:uncharacterized protein LOC143244349 [Tachypleus tridentatus]|uniref:uncharacterized protein LOC143244349 n=1 Tax=Tachypleus tridentatus TaxID=6853 RepID=UPI003FD266FB